MKKVVVLSEKHLKDVIQKVIFEQSFTPPKVDDKFGSSVGPGRTAQIGGVTPSVTLPSGLFKNGVDKIDTNSVEFKNGVNAISKAVKKNGEKITIAIEGGASAVGQAEGYDNNLLAQKRAQNFTAQVKRMFPSVDFRIRTKVGVQTRKNSPEAEREQYVKLIFPGQLNPEKRYNAVDNTQLVMNYKKPPKQIEKKKINEALYYKVCYWIPEEHYNQVMSLIQKVGGIDV